MESAAQTAREGRSLTGQLTAQRFLPHMKKMFRVRGGRHALTLMRGEGPQGGGEVPPEVRQPFNLIFTGPPSDLLPEGIYTLDVEDGPHFELYVIPIYTPRPDRQDYQASFN